MKIDVEEISEAEKKLLGKAMLDIPKMFEDNNKNTRLTTEKLNLFGEWLDQLDKRLTILEQK